MIIPHQGIGRGRLVPSSHKGSKFRYTIVRHFRRGDERIREDIPVPDTLGKETFLVGIYTSRGNLKDQSVYAVNRLHIILGPGGLVGCVLMTLFPRLGMAGISTPWPF